MNGEDEEYNEVDTRPGNLSDNDKPGWEKARISKMVLGFSLNSVYEARITQWVYFIWLRSSVIPNTYPGEQLKTFTSHKNLELGVSGTQLDWISKSDCLADSLKMMQQHCQIKRTLLLPIALFSTTFISRYQQGACLNELRITSTCRLGRC